MSWVRLEAGFFRGRKMVAAGKDGRALWLAGLLYCAENLTDGAIPKAAIRIIAAEAEVRPVLAQRLVDVNAWNEEDDRYVVPDYLDYNPPRARVLREREGARERMRNLRGSGDVRANNDGSSPEVRLTTIRKPLTDSTATPKNARPRSIAGAVDKAIHDAETTKPDGSTFLPGSGWVQEHKP